MYKRFALTFLGCSLALGVAHDRLGAQVRPRRADNAVECAPLSAQLASGAVTLSSSVGRVMACSAVLAAELPPRWRSVGADSAALSSLLQLSAEVRDRRVLVAVVATATDSTRPMVVRAAAVAALASYRNPRRLGVVYRNPARKNRLDIDLASMSHTSQRQGEEAVTIADAETIDRTLRLVAATDSDADVRLLAKIALNGPRVGT